MVDGGERDGVQPMALKQCKDCGQGVSTKAGACPNCGAPVKAKGSALKVGCLAVVLIFAGGAVVIGQAVSKSAIHFNSPESRTAAVQHEKERTEREAENRAKVRRDAITLTVDSLLHDYYYRFTESDHVYDDRIFKKFKVKGTVDQVKMEGKPSVQLKPTSNTWGIIRVVCYFDESKNGELTKIIPNQEIVLYGECRGRSVFNVLMTDCEIAE
jgi:hypothetical protein